MTYTFKALKSDGGKQAAILSRAMSPYLRRASFQTKNEFLYDCLKTAGDIKGLEKLDSCNEREPCLSIYCTKCRIKFVKKFYECIVGRIAETEIDDKTVRESVRFCSNLDTLVPAEEGSVLNVLKAIKEGYGKFGKSQGGTWARGVIDIELIDMRNVDRFYWFEDKKQRKRDIIIDIGGNKRDWRWKDSVGQVRSDYVLIHSYFFVYRGRKE